MRMAGLSLGLGSAILPALLRAPPVSSAAAAGTSSPNTAARLVATERGPPTGAVSDSGLRLGLASEGAKRGEPSAEWQ